MAMKDMFSYMGAREVMRKQFAASDATTPAESTGLDTLGFNSVTFVVAGKVSADEDPVMKFTLKHSDDNVDYVDVPEDQMMVSAPLSYEAPVQKVGYIGGRRYVKLVATMSSALSTATIDTTAVAVMLRPAIAPVA